MSWYSDYAYRKKITIDSTKVDANLTDFPVLVKLTAANFDFAKCLEADNYDIRFTAADGSTELSYTRELHDEGNEVAYYWVKVPLVDPDADTQFFMYYGYSSATDASSAANTYSNNFVAIYPCNDNAANTTVVDSLGNYNGTASANTDTFDTTGKIGNGLNCAGSKYFGYGTGAPYNFTTNSFSYSIQVKTSTTINAGSGKAILSKRAWGNSTEDGYSVIFESSTLCRVHYYTDRDIAISNISDDVWHKIRVDFNYSTHSSELFIDGVSIGTSDHTTQDSQSNTAALRVGNGGAAGITWVGEIDHVVFSSGVRGAAWEKADYNSCANTLVSYSDEEEMPAPTTIDGETTKAVAQWESLTMMDYGEKLWITL